jgi:Protein of unknown function (DUF1579)
MRTILFFACAVAFAAAAQQNTTGTGASDSGTAGSSGSTTSGSTGSAGASGTTESASGSSAPASAAMQHGPAKPAEALTNAFKSSVGSWNCTGKMTMPKEMGGGEMASRSHMTIRRELNGFLYEGEWRVEKSQVFPEMRGKMNWSYDPQSKKLVQNAVDNMGNRNRGESDGAQDGKVVWTEEGVMMGQPSKTRTTVAMNGANKIQLTFEQQGPDGSWQPMGEDNCTKAAGGAKSSASSK